MFIDHLSGVVIVPLAHNQVIFRVHHGTARQLKRISPGNARMRPVHCPGDDKTTVATQRRVDGKAAVVHVSQQMGKVALERKQPVMLTEGIDKRGVRVVKPCQRRWWLGIQRGVVIKKTD